MSIAAAVARLATWSVPGVVMNYAIDQAPDIIPETNLPALVIQPDDAGKSAPFDIQITTMETVVNLKHTLLVRGSSYPGGAAYKTALTILDGYINVLRVDNLLNGELATPLQITSTWMGPVVRGNYVYWGLVLSLRMEFVL